ncbi:MAG: DUF58 domain-containing protein, partial [Polyangiaceae bacterium]|nr:DUF58 domain-containing protein [Polyangiaceae bacterium]
RRVLPGRLVLGIPQRVILEVHNPTSSTLRMRLRDAPPASFIAEPAEHRVIVPPHARRSVEYRLTPTRRGEHRFGAVALRIEGAAGLSSVTVELPLEESAKVYPNVLGQRRAELAGRLGDLRSLGSRSIRVAGGGGELAQLREYVAGDPFRHVSWKATAKRGRPVTRVFDQERSQQIVLCLDAGRMMATEVEGLPKLDHALSAALLLGWVALHNGDRVGALVFSDTVQRFIPPGSGRQQYRLLLEGLYDIEAAKTHVDFRRLATVVREKVGRRSLLVIFSDLLDEAQARPLLDHASMLRARHLPLCVTMADPVLERISSASITDARSVYSRAAAVGVLEEREALARGLEKAAVGWVQAPAGALAIATIRRYLAIKAKREL